jgi:transcriptional regulator with XRE-family HTH domain
MTMQTEHNPFPQWELEDRLAKALRHAGVGKSEMAAELGCVRQTVTNYLSGKTAPSKAVLRVWALRCGVSYRWLVNGETPTGGSDDGPGQEIPSFGWIHGRARRSFAPVMGLAKIA